MVEIKAIAATIQAATRMKIRHNYTHLNQKVELLQRKCLIMLIHDAAEYNNWWRENPQAKNTYISAQWGNVSPSWHTVKSQYVCLMNMYQSKGGFLSCFSSTVRLLISVDSLWQWQHFHIVLCSLFSIPRQFFLLCWSQTIKTKEKQLSAVWKGDTWGE